MIHPFDCFCPHCRGEIDDPNVVQAYRSRDDRQEDTEIRVQTARVATQYDPAGGAQNSPVCDWCGLAHDPAGHEFCLAALDALRSTIAGRQSMLPSSSGSGAAPRRQGGIPYLKNEQLTKQPKEAKILGVKGDPENKFGARVILKLALDGSTYFWGVGIKKNPNYALLEKEFGLDENDWTGQKILLNLEPDEFTEQYFIRVSFPYREPDKKKR